MKPNKVVKLKSEVTKRNILQRLRPNTNPAIYKHNDEDVPAIRKLTEQYIEYVNNYGPYYWFITLTFSLNLSFELCCKYVNHFIRRSNISYFTEDYYKKGDFIEGVAFFEEHSMGNSLCKWHVHMLIKPSYRFLDFMNIDNVDKFNKAASKVTHNKVRVFNHDHIDVQRADNDYRHMYLFKQVNDTCLYRVKMIGVRGLSDNCCN